MSARFGFLVAAVLAAFLIGCGGKEEVKKNTGTITNVAPTAAGAPGAGGGGGAAGGGSATSGAPAAGQPMPPPPIPMIEQ